MRIAHTCANCGHDLSRLCALIDPVYALPIVVCPRCREAVVRTSSPVRARARQVQRTAGSLARLALSVLVTLGLAGAVIGLSSLVEEQWARAQRGSVAPWTHEAVVMAGAVWAVVAMIAGFWLGVMLQHWRRWLVLPAWGLLLLGLIVLVEFFELIERVSLDDEFNPVVRAIDVAKGHAGMARVLGVSLVPVGLGYLAGLPMGARAGRFATRRMWRRRRRIRLRRRNA